MSLTPRPRLTYANVVSTLCLFALLGGGAYAAARIDGSSLKRRSVPGTKLERDAVTGKEVKEASLGAVPAATEAARALRAERAKQAPVEDYRLVYKSATNAPTSAAEASATCPGATSPIAGGANAEDPDQTISSSAPNGTDWRVVMSNADSAPHGFQVVAVCGRVSQRPQ